MCNVKIEDGHCEIFENPIKLRSKFVKKFPSMLVQENVIQVIENLNKSSVLDVFKFLMKSAASKDYLVHETHLEWAELTEEQYKMIWNEIRSQVNSTFKLFSCSEVFENTCNSFVKVWEFSFDFAIELFKSIVKYLSTHNQEEINRVIFLLGSDSPNNNFGGIREIGYSYEEAVKCSKFSYQAFCLMDGLHMNNCYIMAVPLLPYFGESVQSKVVEAEENSKSKGSETTIDETHTSESEVYFEPEAITAKTPNETAMNNVKFTFGDMVDFIKNYELFKKFFIAVGGLKELGIEPQFVLEHEKEFCELLDTIDLYFHKR